MWMVISISCEDCGRSPVTLLTNHKPTDEELNELLKDMGRCKRTFISEVEVNQISDNYKEI